MDLELMKRFHRKVNIVVVIAKADSLTATEITKLKNNILNDIRQNDIQVLFNSFWTLIIEISDVFIRYRWYPSIGHVSQHHVIRLCLNNVRLGIVLKLVLYKEFHFYLCFRIWKLDFQKFFLLMFSQECFNLSLINWISTKADFILCVLLYYTPQDQGFHIK